jgi:hypothetical protein
LFVGWCEEHTSHLRGFRADLLRAPSAQKAMSSEKDILIEVPAPQARPHDDEDDPRPEDCASVVNPLPPGLVFTEWAVAMLREDLGRNGLSRYHICHCTDLDLDDTERYLEALGEGEAAWKPLPAASGSGQPLTMLTHGSSASKIWPSGVLRLPSHQVVLARWYWVDEIEVFRSLWLIAVPHASAYLKLRDDVRRHRRERGARKWQILRNTWTPSQFQPRATAADATELLLAADVRRRVEAEIIGFFAPEVAALYAGLKVPYRRGALLHGPPGNGKTSLIRFIGAALPEVPMLVLRPCAHFNGDSLNHVMKRWSAVAPAALIIEDLDWLLKQVNISNFLNALDGIDSSSDDGTDSAGGLLLIATTNHPDQLDPAVNNRPGRLDVVIEVSPPDRALRRTFFATRVNATDDASLDELAEITSGLSFAHLQEVLRASGLAAIHQGRCERAFADLLAAVETIRSANQSAENGFPTKPEAPFGLAARRKVRPLR